MPLNVKATGQTLTILEEYRAKKVPRNPELSWVLQCGCGSVLTQTAARQKGKARNMAATATAETTEQDEGAERGPGALHQAHSDWIKEATGVEVDPAHIFLVYSTRNKFRASPSYRVGYRKAREEAKVSEEQARAERRAKAEAEREEKRKATEAEKEARKAEREKAAQEKAAAKESAAALKAAEKAKKDAEAAEAAKATETADKGKDKGKAKGAPAPF